MSTTHISFDHVTKVFQTRSGPVTALDDISLEIGRGTISAFIGHSGAGKSTLVRLVNGLEQPTSGRVVVGGTDISTLTEKQLRPLRADIGMVFQQFNLLNSRTIYDNVAYPLRLAGWDRDDVRARVTELLDFVGLTEKAWNHPEQLSGGQKQRVGIARALATRPSVLLADEATSALDPQTTADVLALLRRVNDDLGVTVVVITHEMEVVRAIAEQVSVLEGGRLVETGPAAQVFAHPRTATTRRFLSTIVGRRPSPDHLARLHAQAPDATLVEVAEVDDVAFGAALTALARGGRVDFRIVHGGVIEFRGGSVGNYTVALSGPEEDVRAAADGLRVLGSPGPGHDDHAHDDGDADHGDEED